MSNGMSNVEVAIMALRERGLRLIFGQDSHIQIVKNGNVLFETSLDDIEDDDEILAVVTAFLQL